MNLAIAAVIGVAGWIVTSYWTRQQARDLGTLAHWTDQDARAAAKATVQYMGAPWEYAKPAEPSALTTREQEALARLDLIQSRDHRASQMGEPARPMLVRRKAS